MNNKIILPMEIINKILIMRPTHPIATLLRDYGKQYLYDFDVDNVFYCKNVRFWMQNNDCFMMNCFDYKYKSYRRIYKRSIIELKRIITEYHQHKKYCYDNNIDDDLYTFKTFEQSPSNSWHIVI